jgi:hypothetical protein
MIGLLDDMKKLTNHCLILFSLKCLIAASELILSVCFFNKSESKSVY